MKNNLVDRLKSILLNQELKVDHDQMLDRIFEELPQHKKKKNRFFLIFIFGGLMIIAVSTFIIWDGGLTTDSQLAEITILNSEEETPNISHEQTDPDVSVNVDKGNINANYKEGQFDVSDDNKEIAKSKPSTAESANPKIRYKYNGPDATTEIVEINIVKRPDGSQMNVFNDETEQSSVNHANQTIEFIDVSKKHSKNDPYENQNSTTKPTIAQSSLGEFDQSQDFKLDIFAESNSNDTDKKINQITNVLSPLSDLSFKLIPLESILTPIPDIAHIDTDFDKLSGKLELQLYTSYFQHDPKLESTNSYFSWESQILARYEIGKISPVIGFRYISLNSVLDRTLIEESRFESFVQAQELCPDGPKDCLNYSLVRKTTRQVFYNRLENLGVPIGIEYNSQSRFNWWARTIIVLPLKSNFKFEFIDENEHIVNISDLETSSVRFAPDAQFAAGLGISLSNKIHIKFGAQYQVSLKAIEVQPLDIRIEHNVFSGTIGLGYRL